MDEVHTECDSCGEKTRHTILRVKGEGLVICKCSKCNSLKHEILDSKKKELLFLISQEGVSFKKHMSFELLCKFEKNDVLDLDGTRYEISCIEEINGNRPDSSVAKNVRSIWLTPYEQKISISIHQTAEQTRSCKLNFAKDAVLRVGDVLKLEGIDVTIERISTAEGLLDESNAGHILAIQGRVDEGF
jgi:uncharacterized Zn finger protein